VNPQQPLLALLRAKRRTKRIILTQNSATFLDTRICQSPLEKKKDGVYWIREELVVQHPEEKY
jgi:hypothetical protein